MAENEKQSVPRPGSVRRKGHFWLRFVIGALAVSVIWFLFIRPSAVELSPTEQAQMLDLARRQLVATVAGEELINVFASEVSGRTTREGAAFVSVSVDGALRGCMIDRFEPHEPLFRNVLHNLQLAVRSDERFTSIGEDEIEDVRIKISVVYNIKTLRFKNPDELVDKLSPFVDGVILSIDEELATYLPSVWETFQDPAEFLSQLCVKGGWDANRWRTEPYPTIQTYLVFEFGEAE